MTDVALLLTGALDREWEAQSARAEPLEPTVPVRTLLELVLAGTPAGIFVAGQARGATPAEVVARLRDDLPAELSPWARRSIGRVAALRFSMPLLGPGEEVRALPLPISTADIPRLPAPRPEAEPVERRPSRAATFLAILLGRRR